MLGSPCGLLVLAMLSLLSASPVLADAPEAELPQYSALTRHAATLRLNHRPGPQDVDLELVLAVDVSVSMSPHELTVQRQGYVSALRHPELFAAIATGPLGRVALIYLEWAGPSDHLVRVPWTILSGADDALDFAERLAALPADDGYVSPPGETGTSISSAILFASDLLSENAATGLRRVIDISGDGPNNSGLPVEVARERVIDQGITINGLPIVLRKGTIPIEEYYSECVIGGPGAFTIAVHEKASFETAIRHKMVLEIAGLERPATKVLAASRTVRSLPILSVAEFEEPPPIRLCNRWDGFAPKDLSR
jgi:hypothetical protein